MSDAAEPGTGRQETVVKEYVQDVRIVESGAPGEAGPVYRFEAPLHPVVTFEEPDLARLYADVYFDVDGFREPASGNHGIPVEVFQAGDDTLATYLLTQPHTTKQWVASYYETKTAEIDRYTASVRERAENIRAEV